MTKNLHLEHPEDDILTGNLNVLDWILDVKNLSVKYDGSPAIVWGRNPATGNQFVGTKSVFNKVKIKINENHEDIDRNHSGIVATILHICLDFLPDTSGIYQGDFIGFGDSDNLQPNTLVYEIDGSEDYTIIVAPHTEYLGGTDLRDTIAFPFLGQLESSECCLFIQPDAYILDEDFSERVAFIRQCATMVEFLDEKTASKYKIEINRRIRNGEEITPETFDNPLVMSLWTLTKTIKDDMLSLCCHFEGPRAYLDGEEVDGEGYVGSNGLGSYKLVNREVFSRANFNMVRS